MKTSKLLKLAIITCTVLMITTILPLTSHGLGLLNRNGGGWFNRQNGGGGWLNRQDGDGGWFNRQNGGGGWWNRQNGGGSGSGTGTSGGSGSGTGTSGGSGVTDPPLKTGSEQWTQEQGKEYLENNKSPNTVWKTYPKKGLYKEQFDENGRVVMIPINQNGSFDESRNVIYTERQYMKGDKGRQFVYENGEAKQLGSDVGMDKYREKNMTNNGFIEGRPLKGDSNEPKDESSSIGDDPIQGGSQGGQGGGKWFNNFRGLFNNFYSGWF